MDQHVFIPWQGEPADIGEFDSGGHEEATIIHGPYHMYHLIRATQKFNCGAYSDEITVYDPTGKEIGFWQNGMSGCWQQGHQREASWNLPPELEELLRERKTIY